MVDDGIFSEKIFHHDIYDTGWKNREWLGKSDEKRNELKQLLQDDYEILEIIITSVTSGILEE